jgi:predicted secreted protein
MVGASDWRTSAQDGTVDVIIRESLPRSNDERLEIELEQALPALSKADRWKQDREEKGFLTWVFRVPAEGEASIEWRSKMTYPEDLELAE